MPTKNRKFPRQKPTSSGHFRAKVEIFPDNDQLSKSIDLNTWPKIMRISSKIPVLILDIVRKFQCSILDIVRPKANDCPTSTENFPDSSHFHVPKIPLAEKSSDPQPVKLWVASWWQFVCQTGKPSIKLLFSNMTAAQKDACQS